MNTVFGKNTTSSSITVAGHKMYYIDSTDAEIVEVEGTAGEPLPIIGDTVTFGNYPQATSTPEPIEWTVLDVDSTNGKALLLSKYILDAHVYNTEQARVSWATCTLRDWLNNTFYNAAFNSEEQSEIVTTHNAGSDLSSDDKVFCLTREESKSYIPVEADRRAVATQKAIDDGASVSVEKYGYWWNLTWNIDSYYRARMISSGGSSSNSRVDVAWVGVRPAMWVSFSGVTTFKRNAFKYTLNGTPYWYVIDGVHDTWTDDLSAWGYSEVPVGPVFPTVSDLTVYTTNTTHYYQKNVTNQTTTVESQYTYDLYLDQSCTESFVYDSSSLYLLGYLSDGVWKKRPIQSVLDMPSTTVSDTSEAAFGMVIISNGKVWFITNYNDSIYSPSQVEIECKVCSDNTATVITVYDSSNVAYNAFKFTASGTDYYYVLDGTQTDWTDDLAGIGYSLTPAVVLPTVSVKNDFGSYNRLYSQPGQTTYANVSAGDSREMYYSGLTVSFDSSKSYAVLKWFTTDITPEYTGTNGDFSVVNSSGHIAVKNDSGSTKSILQARVAVCSSNQATVITVYDSSNVAYNAFKFTLSGTDYYYVLDGTQTDWTDDLTGIGYHLPVVFPTVESLGTYGVRNGLESVASGSSTASLKKTSALTEDTSKTTAFASYSDGTQTGLSPSGKFEPIFIVSGSVNVLAAQNVSSETLNFWSANVVRCSDSTATVVTVYDGTLVPYNAFKFTASGTDYYYVLDGTQTDWTDDLSSIGYRLDMEFLLGFKWDNDLNSLEAVNDLSNDYYWARVISQSDKDILTSMGIWYSNISNTKYGGLVYDSRYTYSFVAIYSDMGETIAPQHDPDKCLIRSYAAAQVLGLYYDGTSSESVMTWKCRITKNV